VVFCISFIEVVAAVGDEAGEVRPVGQLEGEDRSQVIATKPLKLAHPRSVVAT
jgi:hypothetical protein